MTRGAAGAAAAALAEDTRDLGPTRLPVAPTLLRRGRLRCGLPFRCRGRRGARPARAPSSAGASERGASVWRCGASAMTLSGVVWQASASTLFRRRRDPATARSWSRPLPASARRRSVARCASQPIAESRRARCAARRRCARGSRAPGWRLPRQRWLGVLRLRLADARGAPRVCARRHAAAAADLAAGRAAARRRLGRAERRMSADEPARATSCATSAKPRRRRSASSSRARAARRCGTPTAASTSTCCPAWASPTSATPTRR